MNQINNSSYSSYKKLLIAIGDSKIVKLACITFIFVMAGQLGDLCATEKFPLFSIYQDTLLSIVFFSFYSIFLFERFWQKFKSQTASCDTASAIWDDIEKKRYSNFNWVYPFIVATLVLASVHVLYGSTRLDLFMRIYCYAGLYVTVFISTIGYTQYVMFIKLLWDVSKSNLPMEYSDAGYSSDTEWIEGMRNVSYKGACLFLIVGPLYILLFYVFSYTGIFGVDLSAPFCRPAAILIWVVLIVFVIIAFPCYLAISVSRIKKTVTKMIKSNAWL